MHFCPTELALLAALLTGLAGLGHVVNCWKHRVCNFLKRILASDRN